MVGPVAAAVSAGELETPAVLQTHGGRARAIEARYLHIDVGFVAAPTADVYSNINGIQGGAACGVLAYAAADIAHADRVVAVRDNLVPNLACPITYSQDYVDFLVAVDSIGDPSKIVSGTTRPTTDPLGLRIADTAARVIDASGLLRDGFSFQTGAGGISLAVANSLRELMTWCEQNRVDFLFGLARNERLEAARQTLRPKFAKNNGDHAAAPNRPKQPKRSRHAKTMVRNAG
jgi:citrate lyase subunit alpha/citrate CoA-transferase